MIRLRENLLLKIISLVASILLYAFVQTDRNPTITRLLSIPIRQENLPADVEVESSQRLLDVSVTGPRFILDRLKEGDVSAVADLRKLPSNEQKSSVSLQYSLPNLPPDLAQQLKFDPASPAYRIQVYARLTGKRGVEPLFTKDPPAGFDYAPPEVRPTHIKVTGRSDRMKRVARIIVNASPSDSGTIDGDFTVYARDSDNNNVDGILFEPEMVHVAVPLSEQPQSKTVPISPSIPDLPLPPMTLTSISVSPLQVKIQGRPERLNQISTLKTEDISLHNMQQSQEIEAHLIIPPDITVRDLSGRRVTKVIVRITLDKVTVTPPQPDKKTTSPPPLNENKP